jgi:CheY-like chemotaxis protein
MNKKKKIILIEDSEDLCKQVINAVEDVFGESNIQIETLKYEKAAENFLDKSVDGAFADLIVIDLMIDYHPNYDTPVPEQVRREGALAAGYRILERIGKSPWKSVPIVVFSSSDSAEIEKELNSRAFFHATVIQKTHTLEPLLQQVAKATGLRRVL